MTGMEKITLAWIAIVMLGCVGFCMNIYKLCKCDFERPIKAEVVRAIGVVVPPVGAVTGFLTIQGE